jgi:hypothetical protein
VVRCEQLADLSGNLHPGGDEHDQVVTDPLQVGDQVGGEHDADPLRGDNFHEAAKELAPRKRVEAREGLVEDEGLGSLRDRQSEGELGTLAARQRPGPLAGVKT